MFLFLQVILQMWFTKNIVNYYGKYKGYSSALKRDIEVAYTFFTQNTYNYCMYGIPIHLHEYL